MANWEIAHALLKYDVHQEPFTTIAVTTKSPYRLDSRDVKGNHANKGNAELLALWSDKRLQEDYSEIYNSQATEEIRSSVKNIEENLDETVNRVVAEKTGILENQITETNNTIRGLETETNKTIRNLEAEIDNLKIIIADNLTPEQEEELLDKYPVWEVGVAYEEGDIVNYDDVLYVVVQAHTSQADWLPSEVASLYKLHLSDELEDGTEVISEWKQPTGAHDAYHTGDKVEFEGKIYESTIDNNTWSPSDYPQGWKEVAE